jgi:hypothetical protein
MATRRITMNKATQRNTDLDELFATIAREELGIETLETRRSDSLDFHAVAVWSVRAALDAAYRAGLAAAKGGKR